MKHRIEGKLGDGVYLILAPDGGIMRAIPLDEAKADTKLRAAIQRNGWEKLDG